MFINVSLPYIYYIFDEMGKGLGHEKKNILLDTIIIIIILKKTLTDDKLTTCSYT